MGRNVTFEENIALPLSTNQAVHELRELVDHFSVVTFITLV